MLAPDYWGNPRYDFHLQRFSHGQFFYQETCFYCGVIPVALALLALYRPEKGARFFRNLLVVYILLVGTPIWNAAAVLPAVSKVNSLRTLFVMSFSICVLAAFGFDRAVHLNASRRWPLAATLAGAALGLLVYFSKTVLDPTFLSGWLPGQAVRLPSPEIWNLKTEWLQHVGLAAQAFYTWHNSAFWLPPLLLMGLAALFLAKLPETW
ncbi:unnamed protein product, partial [Phaeothamnion confervicola]